MPQSKLKVLIDTNIIIHSEDNKEISEEIKIFHQNAKYFDVLIHPVIIRDLVRDNDIGRKKIVLSKLWKYNQLDFNAEPDNDFYQKIIKSTRHNDIIDDIILFSLFCWACDYLVTEDRWIHKKAYALWIKDNVFSLSKFNQYINSLFSKQSAPLDAFKNIIHDKISNISPRPIDEIFDSLKNDYPGFEDWYRKIIREERRGFFITWNWPQGEKLIYGLWIYDTANVEYLDGIKISTFKISSKKKWSKEGEKLLRQIIVYAMQSKKNLYIEVKKWNDFIDWLISFGFYIVWEKKDDTSSLVLKKDVFPVEVDRWLIENYPFYYFGEETGIFIIPIQSRFSEKLFPEIHSQLQIQLEDNVCGNTIKKSYLSRKNNKKMKRGDLIFFYETATWWWISENNMTLISVWVIEETLYTEEEIEAIKFIWKRSVYTLDEIQEMTRWWVFIINFRYLDELSTKPSFPQLISQSILKWPPQSIQEINKAHYNYLKSLLWSYYQ